MRAMPPGWWSDKLQVKVSRLSADSPVRVVLDGAVPVDLQIEVFQIPELMLWRALRRLTGQRRPRVATLRVDTSAPHPRVFGAFSEVWSAAPTELLAPARFVAEADGFPTSDPLLVSDTVVIEVEGAQASAGADLSGIPGSPVSVKVDASTGRRKLTGTVFAPVDPAVELRVITPSTEDWTLRGHLRNAGRELGRQWGVPDPAPIVGALEDEYGEYLADEARLGAEVQPSTFDLPAGQGAHFEIELFGGPGRSLFVLLAVDPNTARPIATSDVVGLTFGDDGEVYRDF